MNNPPKIGILLSNLGSPATPDRKSVGRFLRQFLSDPRVVELPRSLWLPLLYGLIVPLRSGHSAALYRKIWSSTGSPLLETTRQQAEALQQHYQQQGLSIQVAQGMRYGSPNIADGLQKLIDDGCQRLLLLPLYPQYAGATTASSFDAAAAAMVNCRHLPELRMVNDFHDHPAYIQAVASNIRRYWQRRGRGDKLLLSFHGLPQKICDAGDPYHHQCLHTGELIAAALELSQGQYEISFQSRIGRGEWLQPPTDERLTALAQQGINRLDLACPGFPADCLETLEEIAQAGRKSFLQAGGSDFHYLPALNDDPEWIAALATIAQDALPGWITS